jgi:hypothetical protein
MRVVSGLILVGKKASAMRLPLSPRSTSGRNPTAPGWLASAMQ